MKHSSLNSLFDFEFHDAELYLKRYENGSLCVTAKHLNIHKNIKENPYDSDMEIQTAEITFENIEVHSFEPMRAYKRDDNGNWYTDEPQIIYKGNKAEEKFIEELKRGISLHYIDIRQENETTFLECGTNGKTCFIAVVSFDNVLIEWEEYCRKAWYELHRQYKFDITLDTPTGEQKTKVHIHIVYEEDDMYYQGELEKAPAVNVGIKYGEKEIWGHGKDYFWIDAFADLQNKLPEDVKLKCCLVCKHGNMCPVGNFKNELFCTKDVLITEKSDLFFYTEDHKERDKRSRKYTDICECFEYQSWDYFTYNEWLYLLNK